MSMLIGALIILVREALISYLHYLNSLHNKKLMLFQAWIK